MLATLGRTAASEETILDNELLASGFSVDASEALSALLGGIVLSAGGYAKGRFTRDTFYGQTPDAYDATRDEVQHLVPGLER